MLIVLSKCFFDVFWSVQFIGINRQFGIVPFLLVGQADGLMILLKILLLQRGTSGKGCSKGFMENKLVI